MIAGRCVCTNIKKRLFELRMRQLDALYAILYVLNRSELEMLLEHFKSLEKVEQKKYGSYRTKELILEIYDSMADAIKTGRPYQTILDPAPGPPTDTAGNFIPMSQWDSNNWPKHIHLPREESK